MGWEKRGTRWHYYRAERVGGRVVKEYVPPPVAGAAAALDDDRRALRAADAEAFKAAEAEVAARDAPLDRLDALADLIADAALVAAGYRKHHRGEWRKRRDDNTDRHPGVGSEAS